MIPAALKITVFILLKTTNLGIYAVAGVSSIVATIRNLVFTIPYSARCLNQKWYIFFPAVIRPVIFVIISVVLGYIVKLVVPFGGWIQLILLGIVVMIISLLVGIFVILNKTDREYLKSKLSKRRAK